MDLGAQRFTDKERNLIVATTDMPGLISTPIKGSSRKHYSKQTTKYKNRGSVWGGFGVYANNLVLGKSIVLRLSL